MADNAGANSRWGNYFQLTLSFGAVLSAVLSWKSRAIKHRAGRYLRYLWAFCNRSLLSGWPDRRPTSCETINGFLFDCDRLWRPDPSFIAVRFITENLVRVLGPNDYTFILGSSNSHHAKLVRKPSPGPSVWFFRWGTRFDSCTGSISRCVNFISFSYYEKRN